jgi:hypothetical protein
MTFAPDDSPRSMPAAGSAAPRFGFPPASRSTSDLHPERWMSRRHRRAYTPRSSNILSTSSRDGLQCGPAVFPFSWFHHQSRLQANDAAQGTGTGLDRNKAERLTRSLRSLIITSPGIR